MYEDGIKKIQSNISLINNSTIEGLQRMFGRMKPGCLSALYTGGADNFSILQRYYSDEEIWGMMN